nr:hypothetical protein [uncultured Mediterranean phage uvMED]
MNQQTLPIPGAPAPITPTAEMASIAIERALDVVNDALGLYGITLTRDAEGQFTAAMGYVLENSECRKVK